MLHNEAQQPMVVSRLCFSGDCSRGSFRCNGRSAFTSSCRSLSSSIIHHPALLTIKSMRYLCLRKKHSPSSPQLPIPHNKPFTPSSTPRRPAHAHPPRLKDVVVMRPSHSLGNKEKQKRKKTKAFAKLFQPMLLESICSEPSNS